MTKVKRISEFADVITGGTPSTRKPEYWNGSIPWLNSGILNEGEVNKASKYITELGMEKSAARIMPKDTVLIALTGATTGQIGYLNIEATANQSVTGILPSKTHHSRYLYYFLQTQRKKIKGDAFGGGQPHINQKYVKDFIIPLPSINNQIRVATLLNKVESLIAKRKKSIEDLDELLKSIFLEMFGDPVRNEKKWKEERIGDIFSVKHGYAFKSEFFSEFGHYALLTPGNFYEKGGFRDRGDKQKYYLGEILKEYVLNKKDMLVAMTEQAPGLLGSPIIVPESNRFLHNQRLGKIVPQIADFEVLFIFHLFNSAGVRGKIDIKATGTKVRHTSPTKIEEIIVGYPPLNLQNKFAAIVEKVESIKERYRKSLTDLENLYGTLSQKAFKGELDLSRIPLEKEAETHQEIIEPQNQETDQAIQDEATAEPMDRDQELHQS